jgi:acetolactate synthase-1/2/3 large subunit
MPTTVAEYLADALVARDISQVFSVVGGGAMYLNDALGHHPGLRVLYNHHEQASAIAAEAYARVSNRIAAVCVTSGPGGTNALTGCLCGYMGSIPMLIISGQVRRPYTVRHTGLPLRTIGEQEFDIVQVAEGMTKYCVMIDDPQTIRYHLEKALYLATYGRPGPVWLDIPLDVQNAVIEPANLSGYTPVPADASLPPAQIDPTILAQVIRRIKAAIRPVLFCGLGIRLSGAYDRFLALVDALNIPVVTGMSTVDYLPNDHPLYAGRSGATGDRAGNFAVQTCDLLLSIGSRLSLKQTGYATESWAPKAYKIVNDIDKAELQKEHLRIDLPIWANAATLVDAVLASSAAVALRPEVASWRNQCRKWRERYPVVTPDSFANASDGLNAYAVISTLAKYLPQHGIVVTSAGTTRVMAAQAFAFKPYQRMISNPPTAPMGYCLPGGIGALTASGDVTVAVLTSEGGLQMNLQELQTIAHHRMPLKLFIVNNGGYHALRLTQRRFFGDSPFVGIGSDSGDLSFPRLELIARAYGFPYQATSTLNTLDSVVRDAFAQNGAVMTEFICSPTQQIEPKASSRHDSNGNIVSAPLDDMAPFLDRDELAAAVNGL